MRTAVALASSAGLDLRDIADAVAKKLHRQWPAVAALAAELVKRESLTGQEVVEIVRRAYVKAKPTRPVIKYEGHIPTGYVLGRRLTWDGQIEEFPTRPLPVVEIAIFKYRRHVRESGPVLPEMEAAIADYRDAQREHRDELREVMA